MQHLSTPESDHGSMERRTLNCRSHPETGQSAVTDSLNFHNRSLPGVVFRPDICSFSVEVSSSFRSSVMLTFYEVRPKFDLTLAQTDRFIELKTMTLGYFEAQIFRDRADGTHYDA